MTEEEILLKLKKENSFLRVRLLLKNEIIKCLKLLDLIEKQGLKAEYLEEWYNKMNERNNQTDHIFKISGERF